MTTIFKFLKGDQLSPDPTQARRVKVYVMKYMLLDDVLYYCDTSHPLLHCLSPEEANYVQRELHEGIAGGHQGGKALARIAIQQGYYWPMMVDDAIAFA